jgi:hypothetical protein
MFLIALLRNSNRFISDTDIKDVKEIPLSPQQSSDHQHANKFAYWRYCCLVVLILGWVLYSVLLAICSSMNASAYEEIISSLPSAVQPYASKFPQALQLCDSFHSASTGIQLLLLFFAAHRWSNYQQSKQAVKWAWLLMYTTPFALMMVYPYRLMLDWDAASISLCVETMRSLSADGSLQLFQLSSDQEIRSQISPELLKENPSPEIFCHSTEWTRTIVADLSLLKCEFQSPPGEHCCAVRGLATAQCAVAQGTVADAAESSTDIALYTYLSNLETVATTITKQLDNSKFVVGILMGLYAMKMLLPPVLGLINGISSALLHFKVQLPKMIVIAYTILISTAMIVPLLAAFLAAIFQVIGTVWLIPSNVFMLLGAGIFALPCASRWLVKTWAAFGSGADVTSEIQATLKPKIRWIMAVQLLCYVVALGFMMVFIYTTKMVQYIEADHMISLLPQGLTVFVGIYVNTRLSRVAVCDAMYLLLNSELEVHLHHVSLVAAGDDENLQPTNHHASLNMPMRKQKKAQAKLDSKARLKRQLHQATVVARENGMTEAAETIQALADVQHLKSGEYNDTHAALPNELSLATFTASSWRLFSNNFTYIKLTECPSNAYGVVNDGKENSDDTGAKQGVYVAKILYWRFTALTWLLFEITVALTIGVCSLISKANASHYEGVVREAFPEELREFGTQFALGLYYADAALLGALVAPFFFLGLGFRRWRYFKRSAKQVRSAWILMYLVPFLIMLGYPYRALVPYDSASRRLCEITFTELEADGTLHSMQSVAEPLGLESELIRNPGKNYSSLYYTLLIL